MQRVQPGNAPRVVARLTFTTLLTAIVVVCGAVTAAYVFGVMTGRSASAPAKPRTEAVQAAPEPEASPAEKTILRPQDLEYARALRGEERRPAPEPEPQVEAAVPARPPVQEPQASAEASVQEQPASGLADYVFQMAALRDAAAADALREQLEGRGLRTRLERSGKLLLVLVLLRGDAGRVAEVGETARALRLGEPLLRSRKPVGQ